MKKWVLALLHCVSWIAILISNIHDSLSSVSPYANKSIVTSGLPAWWFYLVFNCIYLFVSLTAFYGFYLFVGPLLLRTKKYVAGVGAIAAVLALMVLVRYAGEFYVEVPYLKFHNYFWHTPDAGYYIKNCIAYHFNYCLFGFIAYMIVLQTRTDKEKREIEKEKIQAELSFLRSQVNPHFLFNAINDVYALTYQKSDEAPAALLKLSDILRYMLDEDNIHKVLLEKELGYLKNYIDLQATGQKNNVFVELNIQGQVNGQQIVALLFIPFVENIYKHGVIDDAAKKASVNIMVNGNTVTLTAVNYIKHQQKDGTGGIGLKNTRRRLQLQYPGKHSFVVKEENNMFNCLLKIDLS